jgi:hypothetical protein
MNIDTLLDNIVTALAANEALYNWCNTNYSSGVTIYKGIDQYDPPPETDYPIIHIYPITKEEGWDNEFKGHNVGLTCGISNSASTSAAVNYATVKKYTGIAHIEAMRILVIAAVEGASMSNMYIVSGVSEYETIECFPDFLVNMNLGIDYPGSQGEDVFD